MRNIFKTLVTALALTSAVALSVPAEARRDGWRDRGHHGWNGHRGWRSDHGWHGDRHFSGYRGYHGPRGYYRAPRYYGYGYGYPRYRYYGHRHDDGDAALIAGIAGLAIGAAIASGD